MSSNPLSSVNWHSVVNATLFAAKWKEQMENDERLDEITSVAQNRVRWALRRDSLPLTSIRQAWLKSKRSISPDSSVRRRR